MSFRCGGFCCRNFFWEETLIKEHQLNEQIRDREVRVIGPDKAQLGIMSAYEANRLAAEMELDLVKISPTAVPPVCQIMDYGKFRYEQSKREKEAKAKQKVVELKEVWLSATIDVGDLNTKARSAIKFLSDGDRVRASIRLRGRQMAHQDISMRVMSDFYNIVKDYGVKEKEPVLEGRTIAMILSPVNKK
ncbi:MAG: translation initiation factor IF-3 [Christensenellales bacterium]|jgi:translation initiation factor IF-3